MKLVIKTTITKNVLMTIIIKQKKIKFKKLIVSIVKIRNFKIFVHDGMNSVADYNLLRVGVGCHMSYGCPKANLSIG